MSTRDYSRSNSSFSFDVFNFVPQGHEKALKQAFYNTAAILFVVFVFIAGIAVYFVLEPFLRPLLWAVLFGSVLHPFKRSLTVVFKGWLHSLHQSGTPLAVGVLALPFGIVDQTSEAIGCFIVQYISAILAVSAGFPAIYIIYTFMPESVLHGICYSLLSLLHGISSFLELFNGATLLVWTLAVGYILVLWLWWTPQSRTALIYISPLVWTAIVCHLVTIAGPLRVTILIILMPLMFIGFVAEVRGKQSEQEPCESTSETSVAQTLHEGLAWLTGNSPPTTPSSTPSLPTSPISIVQDVDNASQATQKVQVEPSTPEKTTGSSASLPSIKINNQNNGNGASEEEKMSNLYLYGLVWACIMAQLWLHLWLLHLLPIPIIYIIAKRLASHFGFWSFLKAKIKGPWNMCTEWFEDRKDALVPAPLRGLWKLMAQGDRMVVAMLEGSVDTFTSIGVILVVLILAVVGAIFLAVQVYGESMHLVSVTSSLINRTVVYNSDIQQLVPESLRDVQGTLDSMLGDAYFYGREWISTSVRRMIDEKDATRAAALEKQLLEVWDRVYNLWVTRNTTDSSLGHQQAASFESLVDGLKTLNLDLMLNFVKENIGTFMSVLDSVWTVLKGNISLALSAVTATLSLVFGGGTALLNFFLSFIVFSTSLFYILCASGDQYKPVELFSSLLPSGGGVTKLGSAVEEAVNGVFAASFKMAAFYGLYTWLIHTLFDVKIIYIPSVLAAVFGAVPFLGAYWACLPAVLELWLVNGQIGKSGLMLACQLIPTSFVDSAVYSEIKGGGHPYLTGLAIAGGVFCLGFEGALFGPMLLCFLFVAVNMYGSMMQESPVTEETRRSQRFPLKRTTTSLL